MRPRVLAIALAAVLSACDSTSPPQVATVTIVIPALALSAIGATTQGVAVATTSSGGVVDVASFVWRSANAAVATVSPTGLVTAVGNGTTTISAEASGISGSASVTVAQLVSGIAITPVTVPNLAALGASTVLTAAAVDANNNAVAGVSFIWTSGTPTVATVNAGGQVTAVANGSATITAAASGVTATRTVTVAQVVTSVVAASSAISFDALTATNTLTAQARDAQNAVVVGAPITWSTSAPAVATVNSAGIVTAVANGTVMIFAASGAPRDTVTVNVTQLSTNTAITCPSVVAFTKIGQTRQCSGAVRDRLNQPMSAAITYSSANTSVVTITSNGLVQSVNNGTTTITAVGGGRSGSQTLDVDLNIAFGEVAMGSLGATTSHRYDVVGTQTRVNLLTWMHRTPLSTATLIPQVGFTQLVSGVTTTRFSNAIGRLATNVGQLYGRVDIPFAGTNTDLFADAVGGSGGYVLGVADCFSPHAQLGVGFYNAGRVTANDCAVLWQTEDGTVGLAPGVMSKVNLVAGQSATIEVLGGCTSGAVLLGCTGAGIGDPIIYIFGPNGGQQWYSDDDIPLTRNARVVINPVPTTGAYAVVVVGFNGATGSFTLCAFTNCAAGAVALLGLQSDSNRSSSGAALPGQAMYVRDGWASSLTVEKAERLLKAAGVPTASEGPMLLKQKP